MRCCLPGSGVRSFGRRLHCVREKASATRSWIPSGERRECLGFKDGGGSVNSRPRERYRHINPVALKMYSRLPPRCIYRSHRSTGIQYCTGTKPAASINSCIRSPAIYQIRTRRGPRRQFCQIHRLYPVIWMSSSVHEADMENLVQYNRTAEQLYP